MSRGNSRTRRSAFIASSKTSTRIFAKDRFGSKEVPIFKPVTYELFQELGSEWNDYAVIYDLKTEATPEQLQRIVEFARFVTQASDEDFAKRLGEYLDLEEFAGFVAGHVLLSSYDGFFHKWSEFLPLSGSDLQPIGLHLLGPGPLLG